MSLVGTLGRIAVGIALAKGVGKMMSSARRSAGSGPAAGSGSRAGLGTDSRADSGVSTGGGSQTGAGGAAGDLGSLLGSILGGGAGAGGGGTDSGLDDLGALFGGKSAGSGGMAGGLGGLLESVAGGVSGTGGNVGGGVGKELAPPIGGSLGDLLNSALQGKKIPEPEPAQEDQARILIRAMVNAAKSDGNIDQAEQQKIVSNLGDEVSDEERRFVISEMQAPLDIDGLLNNIPRGAELQVYMMSLLGIDLDSREEARYLDTLRKGIGMSEEQCNAIHQKLGVPTIYG